VECHRCQNACPGLPASCHNCTLCESQNLTRVPYEIGVLTLSSYMERSPPYAIVACAILSSSAAIACRYKQADTLPRLGLDNSKAPPLMIY